MISAGVPRRSRPSRGPLHEDPRTHARVADRGRGPAFGATVMGAHVCHWHDGSSEPGTRTIGRRGEGPASNLSRRVRVPSFRVGLGSRSRGPLPRVCLGATRTIACAHSYACLAAPDLRLLAHCFFFMVQQIRSCSVGNVRFGVLPFELSDSNLCPTLNDGTEGLSAIVVKSDYCVTSDSHSVLRVCARK